MPNYIKQLLQQHQHPTPIKPHHSPSQWTYPTYRPHSQLTKTPDTSKLLEDTGKKKIQQIIGSLLYYARAVDSTMLLAIGDIASAQANSTINTMKAVTHLLNYASTHPNSHVQFNASNMILHVHSDASYLTAPKARSRAGGFFYLSKNTPDNLQLNGPIHIESKIMKHVLASAAEAEIAALFFNTQNIIPLRTTLTEMNHPQPPTPIQTDNAMAHGFVHGQIKQKRSKAIDMGFYWLQDQQNNKIINIYWRPKHLNIADYYTKHHSLNITKS